MCRNRMWLRCVERFVRVLIGRDTTGRTSKVRYWLRETRHVNKLCTGTRQEWTHVPTGK